MAINKYVSRGSVTEQALIESLVTESIKNKGMDFFYIPRTLVSKDEILGEDRLSEYNSSYPIEMYFENIDRFDGAGSMFQKFGLMIQQGATLNVSKRRWSQLIGKYGVTTLPERPCEGDLIYFPLTKGLFEIKYVENKDPFYQLNKQYVYKLQVELFQYASESINTGEPEIDIFETLKTFNTDTTISPFGIIKAITVVSQGTGYTTTPLVTIVSNSGLNASAHALINGGKVVSIVVDNPGLGYDNTTTVTISGGGGTGATATAIVEMDIDKPDSFGDNNKSKEETESYLVNTNNPFGKIT